MPTYDYQCTACGYFTEISHKISEPSRTECPQCHAEALHRKPSGGAGIHFKTSGFYKTDYQKSSDSSAPSCCPCGKNSSCS